MAVIFSPEVAARNANATRVSKALASLRQAFERDLKDYVVGVPIVLTQLDPHYWCTYPSRPTEEEFWAAIHIFTEELTEAGWDVKIDIPISRFRKVERRDMARLIVSDKTPKEEI